MIAILLPETMGSLVRVKDRGIVWEAAGSIKMATAGSAVSCDGNVVLEEADILERATLRKRRRIPKCFSLQTIAQHRTRTRLSCVVSGVGMCFDWKFLEIHMNTYNKVWITNVLCAITLVGGSQWG